MQSTRVARAALIIGIVVAGAAAAAASEPEGALRAEAKVSQSDATTAALAKVPGGTVKSVELEREHGKLIWSFDIATPKSKNITEAHVDAGTGQVVSVRTETPRDQRREALESHAGE